MACITFSNFTLHSHFSCRDRGLQNRNSQTVGSRLAVAARLKGKKKPTTEKNKQTKKPTKPPKAPNNTEKQHRKPNPKHTLDAKTSSGRQKKCFQSITSSRNNSHRYHRITKLPVKTGEEILRRWCLKGAISWLGAGNS